MEISELITAFQGGELFQKVMVVSWLIAPPILLTLLSYIEKTQN